MKFAHSSCPGQERCGVQLHFELLGNSSTPLELSKSSTYALQRSASIKARIQKQTRLIFLLNNCLDIIQAQKHVLVSLQRMISGSDKSRQSDEDRGDFPRTRRLYTTTCTLPEYLLEDTDSREMAGKDRYFSGGEKRRSF